MGPSLSRRERCFRPPTALVDRAMDDQSQDNDPDAELRASLAALRQAHADLDAAVRALEGLPLSVPTTTGVPRAMPGGVIHPAR